MPLKTSNVQTLPEQNAIRQEKEPVNFTYSTQDLIRQTEIKYGLKSNILLSVLKCESGLLHNEVYGDNGLAYGIAQFHKPTFEAFKKESGMEWLKYEDEKSQIELAGWAFANKKAYHWTCWSLLSANLVK